MVCVVYVVFDGNVGCNIVKYIMVFVYFDWLYFLCCGIKYNKVVCLLIG